MSKPAAPRKVGDKEALAVGNTIRGSARKLNLVATLIRGRKVEEALNILKFSPKGMSEESLARWSDATRRALENPQFRERLLANGLTPHFEDTRTFNARIASDLRSWGEVIRAAGIRGD